MNRILVIGCCGAGKSTFSKALAKLVHLPLIHLDQQYWKPNWEETKEGEWVKKVKALVVPDQWIIDGNYGGTRNIRLKRADTIIYLDYSMFVIFPRVLRRIFKYRGMVRPDMPSGCKERFDLHFLLYVLNFNRTKRKDIYATLEKAKLNKQVYIFRNDTEADRFLNQWSN